MATESRKPGFQAPLREVAITSFHSEFQAGRTSCEETVRTCLRRIADFDRGDVALRAIISINQAALDVAIGMDRSPARGELPALFGVPVVVKDNVAVARMPLTGGALAFRDAVPEVEASVIRSLRSAGAVILAKSNLHELALGGTTISSVGGQTRNPYALDRTPGGSSGGTGCALAMNMAMVGIGTDTGQSVRSPASALALIGIRPTRGLVSRFGVMPTSETQDEVGVLGRTADDVARVLEVVAGYDELDPQTASCPHASMRRYSRQLRPDAFRGARIGVLGNFFGSDSVHGTVNAVMDECLERIRSLGATCTTLHVADLDPLLADQWTVPFELETTFDAFLRSILPSAGVDSLRALLADGRVHESVTGSLLGALESGGVASPDYARIFLQRDRLRRKVADLLARHGLDALLYPHQRRLVVPIGCDQLERNGVLAHATGFPAVTFPAGYSSPDAGAPIGVPVGVELLGPEWSEGRLLSFAHAYEAAFHVRVPPRLAR